MASLRNGRGESERASAQNFEALKQYDDEQDDHFGVETQQVEKKKKLKHK